MAAYDLVILGGDAILPSGRTACDIAFRGGKIAAILMPGGEPRPTYHKGWIAALVTPLVD